MAIGALASRHQRDQKHPPQHNAVSIDRFHMVPRLILNLELIDRLLNLIISFHKIIIRFVGQNKDNRGRALGSRCSTCRKRRAYEQTIRIVRAESRSTRRYTIACINEMWGPVRTKLLLGRNEDVRDTSLFTEDRNVRDDIDRSDVARKNHDTLLLLTKSLDNFAHTTASTLSLGSLAHKLKSTTRELLVS